MSTERPAHAAPTALVAIGDAAERIELDAYADFVRCAEAGAAVALVTVIGTAGSAPRGMGAAMAVHADGSIVGTVGGGNLEHAVIAHALESLADGRPRRFHYDYSGGRAQNLAKACLGQTDFYVQPCVRSAQLVIFGAGHISVALAPIAQSSGFRVTVADDRPAYLDAARFPAGVELRPGAWRDTARALPFDADTYAVIVTYGHEQDEVVLEECLHRPWRYLGLIGSRAKIKRLFARLGKDDASRRRLAAVHAPIGLDLGGRSPGEIAVQIAAELLAVRHGRDIPQSLRARGAPPTDPREKEPRDAVR